MRPPHSRLFKAKVIVDEKTFETSEYFATLEHAENAAAKVAVESISLHITQEKSGPPHMPTFISTVEIRGERFQGHKAKTKRLAEVDDAKAAYTSLIERGAIQLASDQDKQHSTVSSSGEEVKETNISAKRRHRCSVSSENVDAPLQDPISPTNDSTSSKKRITLV